MSSTSEVSQSVRERVQSLLSLDSPRNYMCWEDAEESILSDLEDEEAEEYTNAGCSMVEEWFAANEEDEGEGDEEVEGEAE